MRRPPSASSPDRSRWLGLMAGWVGGCCSPGEPRRGRTDGPEAPRPRPSPQSLPAPLKASGSKDLQGPADPEPAPDSSSQAQGHVTKPEAYL